MLLPIGWRYSSSSTPLAEVVQLGHLIDRQNRSTIWKLASIPFVFPPAPAVGNQQCLLQCSTAFKPWGFSNRRYIDFLKRQLKPSRPDYSSAAMNGKRAHSIFLLGAPSPSLSSSKRKGEHNQPKKKNDLPQRRNSNHPPPHHPLRRPLGLCPEIPVPNPHQTHHLLCLELVLVLLLQQKRLRAHRSFSPAAGRPFFESLLIVLPRRSK